MSKEDKIKAITVLFQIVFLICTIYFAITWNETLMLISYALTWVGLIIALSAKRISKYIERK